jgi:hypothetical protein
LKNTLNAIKDRHYKKLDNFYVISIILLRHVMVYNSFTREKHPISMQLSRLGNWSIAHYITSFLEITEENRPEQIIYFVLCKYIIDVYYKNAINIESINTFVNKSKLFILF